MKIVVGGKIPRTNLIAQLLLCALILIMSSLSNANNSAAENFISAFYSWDANKLTSLMSEDADTVAILYYQRWAAAANYKVKVRRPCKAEADQSVCAITVTDDFGSAMGYEATDTFRMSFNDDKVSTVTFSADDPAIFQELFQWVTQHHPDTFTGPCFEMFAGGETPGDCARTVARLAREFMDERRESRP